MLLCLLLPPLLYSMSLGLLERNLEPFYREKIVQAIKTDTESLLNGSKRFEDEVGDKVDAFLDEDFLVSVLGLDLDVMVFIDRGGVIYPSFAGYDVFPGAENRDWDRIKIAQHNYALMNQDLTVRVIARIGHGTLAANLVFAVYLFLSLAVFFVVYKKVGRKAQKDETAKGNRIATLIQHEKDYKKILSDLEKERRVLFESLKSLKKRHEKDQEKASITEEEMFEEIVALEQKLNENIAGQQDKEKEIARLKGELKKNERRKGGRPKRRQFDLAARRFSTLYKNIDMNRRALTTFFELNDDQQIKAEEVIHQLNSDPDNVVVKRKVFTGKKNRTACFEVLFAYNGRLYFTKTDSGPIEVLIIGTKNSQDRDMEFLYSL